MTFIIIPHLHPFSKDSTNTNTEYFYYAFCYNHCCYYNEIIILIIINQCAWNFKTSHTTWDENKTTIQ